MYNLLMFLGIFLLFIGVPASIIATIVFAIKRKKIKLPVICIPVFFVLSLVFLGVGSTMYAESDEYKERAAEREKEQREREEREEEERRQQTEKEKREKKEAKLKAEEKQKKQESQKKKKKKKEEETKAKKEKEAKKKKAQKEAVTETPMPEGEPQESVAVAEHSPEPIPVESSTVLYYMDLYENFENYNGQYVTISAPISYAEEDTVNIKGDIEGVTGMINITLLEERSDLKEGDFITVTGRVDGKALGYLYIKDANISQTGDGSAQIYSQQKAEHDALTAQKAGQDAANFKASCETFDYQDILRNPDSYKDRACLVSGTVDQIIEGWFGSYSIFVVDGAGNKWGCVYSYEEGETRLLEGDFVSMYGKCKGTDTTKTLMGQQITLPRVDVEYIN